MKLRYKIGLVVVILGTTFGLGRCQRKTNSPNLSVPTVLPLNDIEQIVVDPVHHNLIITGPDNKQRVITLPDHPSVIDIHKDGSVQVTSPQSGFEHRFFLGVNGSTAFRIMAGADLFYFKKLDIGIGIMDQIGMYPPSVFVITSYNVWSNVRLGLTYDNTQHFGAALTVRL